MFLPGTFRPVRPWLVERPDGCVFYHFMTYADGSSVPGPWDIRGQFDQYIGGCPVAGKTVLDIGTASGFLAFAAEQAGARVVALEGLRGAEYNQLHFSGLPVHEARAAHDVFMDDYLDTLKAGFWYGWHRNRSKVEVVNAPLAALPYWERRFDVVIAGAILEHLADPVTTIWSLTMLAREAVVIAFTPVVADDTPYMTAATSWDDPVQNYTWWTLTTGLYRRIFANVGFTTEIVPARATLNGAEHQRSTIVARRIRPLPA